jgi:hypothetical protein
MAGSRKTELPVGTRAGMTVARARRLAARTGESRSRTSQVYAVIGAVVVAGMAAYGILGAGQQGTDADLVVAAVGSAAEPAASTKTDNAAATANAPETMAVTLAPEVNAPEATAPMPTELATAATSLEPATEVQPVDRASISTAECINRVEGMLKTLHAAVSTDESWAKQQQGVTELVQATLDCEDAGFQIAGSLELLGSGLADLKVAWDRDQKVLALAMIDRSELTVTETSAVLDENTIQFVIR